MRVRLRTIVEGGVCLLIAAGVLETWLVAGLAVPCQVVGDSMAEKLLGVHRNVVCEDCGCTFSCGSDRRPVAPRAVCPNCGYSANDLSSFVDIEGERLLIDRSAFSLRPPRRWEIIAFRWPQRANDILVKRIVGLPGESVDIRNGDVYIDGQIVRKNLAEQRDLAILVDDANHQPTLNPKLPPRWRAKSGKSGWSMEGGRFTHSGTEGGQSPFSSSSSYDANGLDSVKKGTVPPLPENEPVDWLVYHHGRRLAARGLVGQTFVESPVTDVCGYNQSQPRREEDVHAVADLMLSFRLTQHSGRGDFLVRLNDGGKPFEVRMQFEGLSQFSCQQKWDCPSCCNTDAHPRYLHYQTYFGGKPIQNATGNVWIADAGESLVEVSLVDQQFLLAFDGRTVVVRPFHRSDPPPLLSACPLAIGARRMELTVRDVRVFRDVYYTHPIGLSASHGKAQPVRLGADEYFVLGDNSPISDDSRTWPNRGAIDAKLLVGKPFAAIPSLQFSLWGGWHFQVPNPARIRYIH